MQESALILSEYEEINSLLYKPIIATQRIKYTCINVSANHIVLGSTSGSLYLFKKEGCIFQQLIPLSEGTVTRVLLSPDEKTVALSTKRARVCVISLKPTVKLLSVSNEHLGGVVTCLCWNDKSTEIYVGDDHGKISTIVLSIFTVNGMFQAPSCALMHLDSSIVQTDYISHYLLVSTLTRCYICDTSEEQFKQIGNKARDGDFGACFFKRTNNPDAQKTPTKNQNNEKLTKKSCDINTEDENLLIFCARPGCRLWEVKINGIVTKTHQFKDAFSLSPTKIYQSSNVKTLNINQQTEQTNGTQVLNFSRLYVIKKKYLLSFTTTGLYIIDPVNATVILWTDELKNISAAQIIDEKIYIMKTTGTFHCLVLNYVENLILKLYEMKLYSDCLNACMIFRSDLMKLVDDNSDDILNEQLTVDVQSNDITSILEPVINVLQINLNNPPKRLNSGIVVVNSGSSTRLTSVKNFNGDQKENGESKNGTDDENTDEIVCNGSRKTKIKNKLPENQNKQIISGKNSETEKPSELEIATLNIQTDLQPIYEQINSLKSLPTEIDLENIIKTIKDIIINVNKKYSNINELNSFLYEIIRSIEKNYFYTLLTNTSSDNFEIIKSDFIVNEILRGFLDLNSCKSGDKKLSNKEKIAEPKFLIIGRSLLSRLSDKNHCIELCKNVPYMWRYYLSICSTKGEDIDGFIDLCLDTRDSVVIAILIMMIDEKQWKILVDYFGRMDAGGLDDKDDNFFKNRGIDWSSVVFEIMRQKGTECAMTFLTIIESNLPRIKLKNRIFQSMIFNKLLKHHGLNQVVELDKNKFLNNEYNSICSTKAREQLVDALEKDLECSVDDNLFGNGAHHWGIKYDKKSSTCPCCTLSLDTPVLLGNNGISIFPCGHAYHANCLVQKKLTRCCLHSQNT